MGNKRRKNGTEKKGNESEKCSFPFHFGAKCSFRFPSGKLCRINIGVLRELRGLRIFGDLQSVFYNGRLPLRYAPRNDKMLFNFRCYWYLKITQW